MYDYICTFEDQIGLENELNEYVIMQNIPVKHYDQKEMTIEEAGIQKRSILIVKEIHDKEDHDEDDEEDEEEDDGPDLIQF